MMLGWVVNEERFYANIEDALEKVAKAGVAEVEHVIKTSGIDKEGRIVTGRMLGSVDYRINKLSLDKYEIIIMLGGNEARYAVFQEYGFWHIGAGRSIPGMFSLDSAVEVMHEEFYKLFNNRGKMLEGVITRA